MTKIPEDVMAVIKKAYPENDFDVGTKINELSRTFPHDEIVKNVIKEIEKECEVNIYHYLDGNYDHCHWIEISTSRELLTLHQRGINKQNGIDYLKKIQKNKYFELLFQISMIGPFGRFLWTERYLNQNKEYGSTFHNNPSCDECTELQKQITEILSKHGITVLSKEILEIPIEGMKRHGESVTGDEIPTVYNCLFNE